MAFDVHETSASGTEGSVHLIDLTEKEQEAPFAVREADGSTQAVPGRIPNKAEILAWLEEHPVVVGVATGVLCFSIIAGAMSAVLGSDSRTDTDESAALSEADGGQGSFSSSGSGGANFTSDASKLSRTGAGKILDQPADGETAVGPSGKTDNPSVRNSQAMDPTTASTSDLDQRAAIGDRGPGTGVGPGQSEGPGSNNAGPAGPNSIPDPGGTPTTAGTTRTTLNPGPNVSGPIPTVTTPRVTVSNPTTVTTAGQSTSTPQSSTPTVPTTASPTTPTTAPPTTPTTPTPAPASLAIAAPANGSSHSFESPVSFAANLVSGATQYCWTFIQGGVTARESCSSATTYQLPARPGGLDPGLVTVRVTASGPFGTVSDSIQISLYRSRVMVQPNRDLRIGSNTLRVQVLDLVGATQYCFRLTQSGYDSGALCYSEPGATFNRNHPIWGSLSPGTLTVSATIYGSGGVRLAADSVTIQLL